MSALRQQRQLSLSLEHSQDHFDALHRNAHGTVILWECGAPDSPWRKLSPGDPHIPALLAAQRGQVDRYLTVNEFHGWHYVRLLRSLRAQYVDIDNENLSIDEVLEALRDAQLPVPSAVVHSGRGLHLYWIHNPVPAAALPVWQRCQDILIKALTPLKADVGARDCSRILRLVGSVNGKNGEEVHGLVIDPKPYDYHHLCDEIIGYRKPKAEIRDLSVARARRGERVVRKNSIYTRWHLVYMDLLAIAKYYWMGGVPTGYRDTWLFLSAVAMSWYAQPRTLECELLKQAQEWTPGLSDREALAAIKTPLQRADAAARGEMYEWQGQQVDPRYRFKRETLWQLMSPIIPDDLAPQLRAIIPDEIKTEHEREREAKRDRVAEGKYKTHQVESVARAQPWVSMGISRRTYYRRQAAGTL